MKKSKIQTVYVVTAEDQKYLKPGVGKVMAVCATERMAKGKVQELWDHGLRPQATVTCYMVMPDCGRFG